MHEEVLTLTRRSLHLSQARSDGFSGLSPSCAISKAAAEYGLLHVHASKLGAAVAVKGVSTAEVGPRFLLPVREAHSELYHCNHIFAISDDQERI